MPPEFGKDARYKYGGVRSNWQRQAVQTLRSMTARQRYLTVDDLYDAAGEPADLQEVSAVLSDASAQQLIRDTGHKYLSHRPDKSGPHHRRISVYMSVCNPAVPPDPDPVRAYQEQRGEAIQEALL